MMKIPQCNLTEGGNGTLLKMPPIRWLPMLEAQKKVRPAWVGFTYYQAHLHTHTCVRTCALTHTHPRMYFSVQV